MNEVQYISGIQIQILRLKGTYNPLVHKHECELLGIMTEVKRPVLIGYSSDELSGEPVKSVDKRRPKLINGKQAYCCYCEVELTVQNYTREHVIPKHKGGKVVKPCCSKCNSEKGGLMLHSYLQLLNIKYLNLPYDSLGARIYLRKIKNANKIAKELEANHE